MKRNCQDETIKNRKRFIDPIDSIIHWTQKKKRGQYSYWKTITIEPLNVLKSKVLFLYWFIFGYEHGQARNIAFASYSYELSTCNKNMFHKFRRLAAAADKKVPSHRFFIWSGIWVAFLLLLVVLFCAGLELCEASNNVQ